MYRDGQKKNHVMKWSFESVLSYAESVVLSACSKRDSEQVRVSTETVYIAYLYLRVHEIFGIYTYKYSIDIRICDWEDR